MNNDTNNPEEANLFHDMLLRFLAREVAPGYEEWEKNNMMPRQLWNTFGTAGLLCVDIPEQYGAADAGYEAAQVINYETSRLNYGGLSSALNIHSNIVAPYILHIGSDEQKVRWLPAMVSGEAVGALGMSEPNAGSDVAGMRTTAVRDGDTWVINGSKIFITNGIHADLLILCAKTTVDAGARGISLFLVDTSLPGFSRGRRLAKIGQHAGDTAELFFDNLRVPADALLGEENKGFFYLMDELPRERIGCAAQAIGAADGALALTIDYVKERKAFGQTIAQFQNTRFKIASLKSDIELNRALLERCKTDYYRGTLKAEDAAILKYTSTEMQCEVVDKCLQLFGGYGYMREYPISRFYVDARVQTIYAGSSEIMQEIIARPLLDG